MAIVHDLYGARALSLIALLLWPGAVAAAGKTDADRIADVHAIAELAEAFKEARGHYPLADMYADVAIAAHLSDHPLPEHYQLPPPGRSGVVLRPGEFEDYMRATLGPGIEVPRDDRPVTRLPHYYAYVFDGRDYYVSAVLERPTEHSRNVGGWYEKYEVASRAVPEKKIRRFADLAPAAAASSGPGEPALYPDVVAARATREPGGSWRFDVTLSSPYDTVERYADAWRVLAPDGTELGVRVLTHGHPNEQPFTRSLSGVEIPPGVTTVTVQGRDRLSGWGGATLEVDLGGG